MAGKIVISELEPDSTYDSGITLSANTTTDALRITQVGTGNALVVEDSASPDSTPFVINQFGKVVVGDTTARQSGGSGSPTPPLQVVGSTFATSSLGGFHYQDGASNASMLSFNKSRGTSLGTQAVVQDGDRLGGVEFTGSDGTAFLNAARIQGEVDGTPGTGDMPGRIKFLTRATGGIVAEKMVLTSDGYLRMASGSGGIQFNGDTAAANALDDYEEGTFTPSFQTTNNNLTNFGYSVRTGFYTKIGNVVTVSIELATINAASITGTGILSIIGLPFAVANISNGGRNCLTLTHDNRWTNNPQFGQVQNFDTNIKLYKTNSMATGNAVGVADMVATNSGNYNIVTVMFTYLV